MKRKSTKPKAEMKKESKYDILAFPKSLSNRKKPSHNSVSMPFKDGYKGQRIFY